MFLYFSFKYIIDWVSLFYGGVMKLVVFVDDERLILRGLKNVFKDQENKYVFFKSAQEAITYMTDHKVDLLCTDIQMPVMDGFDLLRYVKENYPQTMRVALSSFSQKSQVKKLLNESLAQVYVFKPWDDAELKSAIFKLLNTQTSLYSHEMLEFIDRLESLPTLPEIYTNLTNMVLRNDPVEDISKLIEEDQAVTSVILRVANSAFYGRVTGNIPQAIMNIGLENLKAIVLANAVFQELSVDLTILLEMWQHATLSNKIASAIYSKCLNKSIPSLFASAGLLHDIGKLVMYHTFKNYKDLLKRAHDENTSLLEIELDEFGLTHQDLGAYLLNWWDLPYAYTEVAMFHHRPFDYRVIDKELLSVIHLAHCYAERAYNDADDIKLDEKAFAYLNEDKDTLEAMLRDELDWSPYE